MATYVRKFDIDPYRWELYLFSDRAKWAKFVTRRMGAGGRYKEAMDSGGITLTDRENSAFYVGIFDGSQGTLAHEITHVAMGVLSTAGVVVDVENQEPLAYLIGHLVDLCNYVVEN